MATKIFEDEMGRAWKVTKWGSSLLVNGERNDNETLIEIARSCARRLGVTHTGGGVPLKYVNEHRRVWNCVWERGRTE